MSDFLRGKPVSTNRQTRVNTEYVKTEGKFTKIQTLCKASVLHPTPHSSLELFFQLCDDLIQGDL